MNNSEFCTIFRRCPQSVSPPSTEFCFSLKANRILKSDSNEQKKSKFNKFLLLLSFDFGLASSIWCSRCSDVASQSHARCLRQSTQRECSIIHRYNGENTAAAQRSKFFYSLSWKFFIFSTLFSDAFSVLRVDPVSTPIFTRRLHREFFFPFFMLVCEFWAETFFTSLKFLSVIIVVHHTHVRSWNMKKGAEKMFWEIFQSAVWGGWAEQTIQFSIPLIPSFPMRK